MPGMLARLNKIMTGLLAFGPRKQAGSTLPPIVDPKVPTKPQAQPSYSKRTKTSTGSQRLAAVDRQTANTDLLTLRNGVSTKATIHDLAAVSPDFSGSLWAYLRMVVTRNFMGVARNQDGTANPEATAALQQVIARFNYLTDYTDGFSGMQSIHSVAEALAKELRLYGSCAMELVLDKARLPNRLQPISTTQIYFYEDGTVAAYPQQQASGALIPLDQPTFFYEALDQDLLSAYSDSPMEAGLQAVIADTEFFNDVRRTIKRALHPRLSAKIDLEKLQATMPQDIAGDPDKVAKWQQGIIDSVQTTVNGLEPDDALVSFDTVEFDYLNNGNVTLNKEWDTLQAMTNAKMATGIKAPPAVLGHGSGSQNVASTESMLFVRYAEGIQNKLNSILSRALTLGVRLLGYDVYVVFEFDRVDLRPDSELEAFKVMKQSRVLEQLSLGLITDEEACLQITGGLPPAGYKPLSGTFFMSTAGTDSEANPLSNTSSGQQSTVGKAITPSTPQQPKGPAKPAPGKGK